MGTNYYLCLDGIELFHLGKSSIGWKFLCRALSHTETFEQWKERFEILVKRGAVIRNDNYADKKDEYVSLEFLLDLIEGKKGFKTFNESFSYGFYNDGDYCFCFHDFD